MTTFLRSQKINTLFGIFISLYVCILTRRLVHPTSPVLLTKNGPLKTIPFSRGVFDHSWRQSFQKCRCFTCSKFENKLSKVIPNASNHSLYKIKLYLWSLSMTPTSLSYPEGNFNVNQLPNVSISLSPLNSNQTNDLHVSTASYLHQNFSWLCTVQA
jgi:hypothetical protein